MISLSRTALVASLLVACGDDPSTQDDPPNDDALVCPEDGGPNGALVLDGTDDHATPGVKTELGLAKFTLEAWVRRDGAGVPATSGAGGLLLVPIATKGLGEGDGSNIDCNYAFGFAGDVLGADFEDMATGGNHPVLGKTPIRIGEWHHVAATFDGAKWQLYVDGVLDAEAATTAVPRADSVHAFGLGTAIRSDGMTFGFMHGALDEVRVWNRARTAEEIADGAYRAIAMADGLVARWSLDMTDNPLVAADSIGTASAMVLGGASYLDHGAQLDQGGPPVVGTPSPADGAMSGAEVTLDVPLELAAPAPVNVTYHLREVSDADDFTIVVLPDTQIYTLEGRNLEKYFNDQTQWIRDHRVEYNIVGVIHNGDVINNEPELYQWNVADRAMKRLETAEPGLPDGVPYAINVGNHDNTLTGSDTTIDTTKFNQFFGVQRYASRAYYGGHYGTKNDHSWVTFSAGGLDFVVVSMMYELDPDPAAIAWARSIFQMYPDAFGILATHYVLGSGGGFSAQARQIYEALKDLPQVKLMTGGHVSAESRRKDTFEGNVVHSMLADYQGRTDGGAGVLRIWEFSPASNTISVKSYSPTLDKFETDADSEFTLDVDLRGAGGPFREYAVTDADPLDVGVAVDGIEVGKTYEWYADIDSCGKRVKTPLYRFTTAASARAADEWNQTHYQPPRREPAETIGDGPVHVRPDDPSLAD